MTRPLASIILYCGFRQIPHRGTGIQKLYRRICTEVAHDRRLFPLVALRPWNSDFDTDAELIEQADSQRLILIGYSYGCGWAIPQLAKRLNHYPIHLAALIDPVKRYGIGKLRSLRRGGKLEMPSNVIKAAAWRTTNDPGWFNPMGHEVVGAPLIRNVAYGTESDLRQHAPDAEPRIDPHVDHMSIDDRDDIHDEIIGLVRRVIAEVDA